MNIGTRIREWRRYRRRPQSYLATRLNVSIGNISRIETGKQQPSEAQVRTIAESFGLNMQEFYGFIPTPPGGGGDDEEEERAA
jgi:transcriptional regulator with XRE-family HTH domain